MLKPVSYFGSRATTRIPRRHKSTSKDTSIIDNALSLFRPKPAPLQPETYRPSLLSSARNGPLAEQIKTQKPFSMPRSSLHLTQLAASLDILFTPDEMLAVGTKLLKCSDKEFRKTVNAITSEHQLVDIAKLLLSQDALTLNRLRILILSPHLTNLKAVPFNVNDITTDSFKAWNEPDVVRFRIIMLKKYHDLKKPINVIKNLRLNFESHYLPMFQQKILTSFYERIVWRYYFEYIGDAAASKELMYIEMLNDVYHTFAIWQASRRNQLVAQQALLKHYDLNELQTAFFELCSKDSINDIIAQELQSGRSDVLSTLKRVSIAYNVHALPPLDKIESPDVRTSYYMVIDSLENIIQRANAADLAGVKQKLDKIRRFLTKIDNAAPQIDWEDKLLFLQNYMK